jgi:hypothetical protein
MTDTFEELLAAARKSLAEQQDGAGGNDELGEDQTPDENGYFAGRWRGEGQMTTRRGDAVRVFLVWDRAGAPGFLYAHARLVAEVDAERPQVGDDVVVLRGEDEHFEKDGQQRTIFPYVLRKQACGDPLPGPPAEAGGGADDDIPFMPTLDGIA